MAVYTKNPAAQFFYPNGQFLRGGKLYVYKTRTTNPIKVYPTVVDANNNANYLTNPIILNQQGIATFTCTEIATFKLTDMNDNVIWTLNDISPFTDLSSANIYDSNGNVLVSFSSTNSAVNEITILNAATGSSPTISATGDDTNIDLDISGQGTGVISIDKITISSNYLKLGRTDAYVGTVGNPGEILETTFASGSISAPSGNFVNVQTLNITAGHWLLSAGVNIVNTGGVLMKQVDVYLQEDSLPGVILSLVNGGSHPSTTLEIPYNTPNVVYTTSGTTHVIRLFFKNTDQFFCNYVAWIKARRIG